MKTVNPLGRIPETEETMAQAGCHCVCNVESGNHDITGLAAWVPLIPDCQCSCAPNDVANSSSNHSTAYQAAQ